jgi:hypothetical protein
MILKKNFVKIYLKNNMSSTLYLNTHDFAKIMMKRKGKALAKE